MRKQFLRALLSYCENRDISSDIVCTEAGISKEKIVDDAASDISLQQLSDLWRCATEVSQDPFFGLHFGESLSLVALGVVGDLIKTSATVSEAMSVAVSIVPSFSETISLKICHHNEKSELRLSPVLFDSFSEADRQMADFILVFSLYELDGLLMRKIRPMKVSIPRASTPTSEYARILRCAPDTNPLNYYAVELDADLMRSRLITADAEARERLVAAVASSTNALVAHESGFKSRVRDFLVTNSFLGLVTLEDVAANFNMTPRSLQRRLRSESTTFHEISEEVRRTLAIQFVRRGTYPVKEISAILGYNEVSAFSRAFKRWTGQAPMSFNS